MQSLNETFGSDNIKLFLLWNAFFTVYAVILQCTFVSVACFALALTLAGRTIIRLFDKKPQESEPAADYLPGWQQPIINTIHSTINSVLNWLARIFTESDVIEIVVGLVLLYLVQLLCFYYSDYIVSWALGGLLIMFNGLRELARPHLSSLRGAKDTVRGYLQQYLPQAKVQKAQ